MRTTRARACAESVTAPWSMPGKRHVGDEGAVAEGELRALVAAEPTIATPPSVSGAGRVPPRFTDWMSSTASTIFT